MRKVWAGAIGVITLLGLVAATRAPDTAPRGTVLSVTGTGVVPAPNNRVTIAAGIETSGDSASAAMAANRQVMARLLAKLAALGIARGNIQTTGISLSLVHDDSGDSKRITGYRMQNGVSIDFNRIDTSGTVLDALVAEGANQISGPSIQLVASPAQIDVARALAMRAVRARAEVYARATGLSVRRIVTINDGSDYSSSRSAAALRTFDVTTPIEGGRGSVSVSVSAQFELG